MKVKELIEKLKTLNQESFIESYGSSGEPSDKWKCVVAQNDDDYPVTYHIWVSDEDEHLSL